MNVLAWALFVITMFCLVVEVWGVAIEKGRGKAKATTRAITHGLFLVFFILYLFGG